MRNYRSYRISVIVFLACVGYISANTWYVDPVNGSDGYSGTSPFFVPGTSTGPARTIQRAASAAGQYDIVVLLDGFYSGSENTSSSVMGTIDSRHLYVISDGGPENCTLELYQPLNFSVPLYMPAELETVISGVSFVCDTILSQPVITVQNNGTVHFDNCVFQGIRSSAPVIYIDHGLPVFRNCRFTDSTVNTIFWCQQDAFPEITDCTFSGNMNFNTAMTTSIVYSFFNASPTLRRCTFSDNSSSTPLYAVHCRDSASVLVDECAFQDNTSSASTTDACAAIYFDGTGGWVSSTRFTNNRSTLAGTSYRSAGVMARDPADIFIDNCKFYDNAAGIYVYASGSEYRMQVHGCEFIGNTSLNTNPSQSEFIGGIVLQTYGLAEIDIRECTFQNNYGGIRTMGSADFRSMDVTHCLITNNTYIGAGIMNSYYEDHGLLHIDQCTFVDNSQFELQANYALVENTIVRHTPSANIPNTINITINYSDIQGGWMGLGTGNIDFDPLFADGGTWHPDPLQRIPGTDFHLKSTAGRWDPGQETWVLDTEDSPCIDAGDPAVVPVFEPYGSGGRVNMGVYGNTAQASRTNLCEGGYDGSGAMFSDINHDCLVNLADFAVMAGEWLESTYAL